MYTKIKLLIILAIIFINNTFAQFAIQISTDKDTYQYGEKIHISCRVTNISDTISSIMSHSFNSCDANFEFNNYDCRGWMTCLPTYAEINFPQNSSFNYYWTIDPYIFGIPNREGEQQIIGHYFYNDIRDTIYIHAPEYLGGRLFTKFSMSNDSLVSSLKDSLNVEVITSSESNNEYSEYWQISGINLDTLYNFLSNDHRINYTQMQRAIEYDSMSVTSVQDNGELFYDFYLSEAYPNPFNATTRFYVEIPGTEFVNIELFNLLGEKVSTIHAGQLTGNFRYTFEIDASHLSSGVYYFMVRSANFAKTKKIVLLK